MFEFRPHKMQIQITTGGGVDESGNPVQLTPAGWSEPIECRFVQDDRVNRRIQPDGTFKFYQYCVVLDDLDTNFDNRVIRLFDADDNLVVERSVNCSNRGQLIQRLWL